MSQSASDFVRAVYMCTAATLYSVSYINKFEDNRVLDRRGEVERGPRVEEVAKSTRSFSPVSHDSVI